MAQLSPSEQRDLIGEYVDRAQINWAHIAIAQLMKHGHVDRILTTNFDPLVVRACALVGEFPAVYDLAASQRFDPEKVPGKAVFYLHGQRTGFVLVNTQPDGKKQAEHLAPVFEDAGRGRMWIVAGYSGESDPVFETLAQISSFGYPLYWVGYEREAPPQHVKEKLLGPNRHYVNSAGADRFFIEVAKRLDCFPPEFVGRPFSHLDTLLRSLTPFPLLDPDQAAEYDTRPRELIRAAIRQYEEARDEGAKPADETVTPEDTADFSAETLQATTALMAGDYERVLALQPEHGRTMPAELADSVSWAYVIQGNLLQMQAERQQGEVAEQLFAQAEEKYAAALAIKPDAHEVLNNWGSMLQAQAERQQGEKADQFFAQAEEKYVAALAIKPDAHEVFYNWGIMLRKQAERQQGRVADQLFALAKEKYAAAIEIKPDKYAALNNWGIVLQTQAERQQGEKADQLFALAGEKYAAAIEIKPDMHEALSNWGIVLQAQAERQQGEKADQLFALAVEKYAAALEIKPDMHEVLNNWGGMLQAQAERQHGEEADQLFAQAEEKYAAALEIKPDAHEALNNWGSMLRAQAERQQGEKADQLFAQAGKKYAAALEIKPDNQLALYNWGNVLLAQSARKTGKEVELLWDEAYKRLLESERIVAGSSTYALACLTSLLGDTNACRKWLEAAIKHDRLPSQAHLESDSDLDNVRGEAWFQEILARAN